MLIRPTHVLAGLLAVVLIGVVIAAYVLGGRTARQAEELRSQERRIETLKQTQEMRNDVDALDDDALGAELRRRLSAPDTPR